MSLRPVNGAVAVTAAGTAVQVTNTSTKVVGVVLSNPSSTAYLMVGGSGAKYATNTNARGVLIPPGGSVGLEGGFGEAGMIDLSDLYVDANVNGSVCSYVAFLP